MPSDPGTVPARYSPLGNDESVPSSPVSSLQTALREMRQEGKSMNERAIPAEAVEAAAKGIAVLNLSSKPWEGMSEEVKNTFRDDARAALEAAAPYMLNNEGDK